MAEEKKEPGEWQLLSIREGQSFPAADDVREEDAETLPLEFIHEPPEDYTAEQREKLSQRILAMGAQEKFRLAILGNREARNLLIHDPNKIISIAVLRNLKLNESEVLQYAQMRNLSREIILGIAKDQKWRKSYPVRFALASNPKTPASVSLNFLPHLLEKDLKALSRGKDVPSPVSRAAESFLKRKGK